MVLPGVLRVGAPVWILVAAVVPAGCGGAAAAGGASIAAGGGYAYEVFLPAGYEASPDRRWPTILFLHGAGGLTDADDPIPAYARSRADAFPFVVVRPRTSAPWSAPRLARLLGEAERRYRIDPARIYGTGMSMGAYGTWALAVHDTSRFAAIALVAGGGTPDDACRVGRLPVRLYHNAVDPVVPVAESRRLAAALERCGSPPGLTIYDAAPPGRWAHDAWTRTYRDSTLYAWFLEHRR